MGDAVPVVSALDAAREAIVAGLDSLPARLAASIAAAGLAAAPAAGAPARNLTLTVNAPITVQAAAGADAAAVALEAQQRLEATNAEAIERALELEADTVEG